MFDRANDRLSEYLRRQTERQRRWFDSRGPVTRWIVAVFIVAAWGFIVWLDVRDALRFIGILR